MVIAIHVYLLVRETKTVAREVATEVAKVTDREKIKQHSKFVDYLPTA